MEESVICNIHKIKLKPRYECHLCRENEEYNTRIPPATAGKSVDVGKLANLLAKIIYNEKREIEFMLDYMKEYSYRLATAIKEAIENGTL